MIREAVGDPDLERETIKVPDFQEKHLSDYFTEIEEIVFRAEKKFQLQKKLKKLKDDMKNVEIQTFRHEKAQPAAWVLKAYDELNTVLDDQILQT